MISAVSKALCLHAQANDLKFLNPVRNRLAKLLGTDFQLFAFGDQHSEASAKLSLQRATGQLVVVFCHGASTYLRGGEYRDRTGEIAEREMFISKTELAVFNEKIIFCMSCESNGLAISSLNAGAIAFVGFDEIPFLRFDEQGRVISSDVLTKHTQALIAEAIQASLERFISGKQTLEESIDYLRLWICRSAINYVRKFKTVSERREIAALLLKVKNGVRYYGPRDLRFQSVVKAS